MKLKLIIVLAIMTIVSELKSQNIEVPLVPNINRLFNSLSPEDFAKSIKQTGYSMNSDQELINELKYIKNRFVNKKIFYGVGISANIKNHIYRNNVANSMSEISALSELLSNANSIIENNKDTLKLNSASNLCFDNFYKFQLKGKNDEVYTLMILLQDDLNNKKDKCSLSFKIFTSSYIINDKNNSQTFKLETIASFYEKNEIVKSVYIQSIQDADKLSTSFKETTKKGIMIYIKNEEKEEIDFVENK